VNTVKILPGQPQGEGLISENSPLAKALIGLTVGQVGTMHFDRLHPERQLRVLKIDQN
jgi:transcription elongation GreA/GreB family factor